MTLQILCYLCKQHREVLGERGILGEHEVLAKTCPSCGVGLCTDHAAAHIILASVCDMKNHPVECCRFCANALLSVCSICKRGACRLCSLSINYGHCVVTRCKPCRGGLPDERFLMPDMIPALEIPPPFLSALVAPSGLSWRAPDPLAPKQKAPNRKQKIRTKH